MDRRKTNLALLTLLVSGLGFASLQAKAEQVSAVNLTNSSIDFSVNGGAGPLMGPNENASTSNASCCAHMPSWSSGLTVEVKWEADQDPYSYTKNPYKRYTQEWYDWMDNYKKDKVSYHMARVSVPEYTKQTAANVVAIFLPCHQVMVVNTYKNYRMADFPEKATIEKRNKELKALEKAGRCPALQYPAKNSSY